MQCDFYLKKLFGVPDPRFAGQMPKPQYVPDRNFRTIHIKIGLDIDFEKKAVTGECTTTLKALNGKDRVVFDAVDFKAVSVKDGKGRELKHKYDGQKIEVTTKANPDDIVTVTIKYKLAEPRLGIYFTGPDKSYPKKPRQVWSHSETEDARYWFPVQDLPDIRATTETVITVPHTFIVVSNGALLKTTESKANKTKTFQWKMSKPHSPYLVSFAAGDFSELKDSWKGVPITYYCEKGREDEIKRAFGKTPQMMDFYSKKTGVKYPYEKYAQVAVVDFIFGGMEHTTCTTQTDSVLHDERAHEEAMYSAEGLCAHELAHQWFGDLITCRDWAHAWLNESFATYFDALFVQEDKGDEMFLLDMETNAKEYLLEDRDRYRRPIVTNLYRRSGDLFDRHLYQKGACVLRMLHSMLADEMWWKAINHYIEKNKYRSVDTYDFIQAIEEVTGQSVKKFFDQWVFGPGHPEYKVLYHWDEKTREANVRIMQTQADPLFSAVMRIEFATKTSVKKFDELIEQKEQLFKYKLDSEPLMLRVDPDNVILKRIETVKPRKLWIYQLEFDPNPVGRIAAATEIARHENGTAKDAEILGKALLKEKFWGVQAEIAGLLGRMRNQKALEYLRKGLEIRHPLAKRAVVAAISTFKDPKIIKEMKHLLDDKESYAVPAEVCRALGKTKDREVEALIRPMLDRDSWVDSIRSGAVEGLAHLHGEDGLPLLIKYAQPGNFNRTRMMSIRHIGMYGKGNEDALKALVELADDRFTLVQIAAAFALGELADERAIPALEKLTKPGNDARLQRTAEDSIKKIYPWLETDLETYRASKQAEKKAEKKEKA